MTPLDPISTPSTGTNPVTAPIKTTPAKAPSSGTANPDAVKDMDSFAKEHPDKFQAMMESLAQNMCSKSKRATDRIKEAKKEYDSTSG